MSSDLSFPLKFSGAAQIHLFTRYGDPETEGFEEKWITNWEVGKAFPWFPAREIKVHKHFWPMLSAAFRALEMKSLNLEIKTFEEAFNIRCVRGSKTVLSTHSWGCAIDLNGLQNPLASEGTWSKAFLETMSAHDICCGQKWNARKDPMHFAMVDG